MMFASIVTNHSEHQRDISLISLHYCTFFSYFLKHFDCVVHILRWCWHFRHFACVLVRVSNAILLKQNTLTIRFCWIFSADLIFYLLNLFQHLNHTGRGTDSSQWWVAQARSYLLFNEFLFSFPSTFASNRETVKRKNKNSPFSRRFFPLQNFNLINNSMPKFQLFWQIHFRFIYASYLYGQWQILP